MLTIANIEKLYKKNIGEWRVRAVETTNTAYLIHLLKANGETHQINIERNPIGYDTYEMWMWKGNKNDPFNYVPERIVLSRVDYETLDSTLTWLNTLIKK